MSTAVPTSDQTRTSKNVYYLVIGFGIVMLAFCGAQQFVSTYLPKTTGLISLILVYSFFGFSSLTFAPLLVAKYGCKFWLMVSSVFFGLYIASLTLETAWVIFVASAFLGVAAGMLWIAGYAYLARASRPEDLGHNSGLFYMAYALGACVGIFVLGVVTTAETFRPYFLMDAAMVGVAMFFFSLLDNIKPEVQSSLSIPQKILNTLKTVKSPTALKASTTAFLCYVLFGLTVAQIPLQLKNIGMQNYVSGTAIFFLLPGFLSQKSGALSDRFGRIPVILLSYVLGAIGLLILAISHEKLLLFAGLILMTLSYTILQPCFTALQGDIAPEDKIENISGLFLVVRNLGIVSVLVGANFFDISTLYFVSVGAIGVSFLLLFRFPKLINAAEKEQMRGIVAREIHD